MNAVQIGFIALSCVGAIGLNLTTDAHAELPASSAGTAD